MSKVLYFNSIYFLSFMHWKYMKCLFRNIQKQWNMLKIGYFLRKLQTSWVNNLRILRIKNAKLSGYCFYMNANI